MREPLVTLSEERRARELRRARETEAMHRDWRRRWQAVFGQCVGLAVLGYVIFGLSFGTGSGDLSSLMVALGFAVAYVIPFFRLVFFFVKNADQF